MTLSQHRQQERQAGRPDSYLKVILRLVVVNVMVAGVLVVVTIFLVYVPCISFCRSVNDSFCLLNGEHENEKAILNFVLKPVHN